MSLRNVALQRHVIGEHRDVLPPELLAVSTAWSARRSRSEVVSLPGSPSATPMLTVRVSISPSMETRSRSALCRRSASASADVGTIAVRGDHDELVAAESGDQAAGRRRPAQSFGEHPDEPVAGVVAEVVVDGLEPVEVEEQRRDGAGLACGQSGVEMGTAPGGCAARSGRRVRPGNAAALRPAPAPGPGRTAMRWLPER